ncbi:MAG: hypothetical protein ACRCV3_03370 [Desulfovibrionaceae bacterium]
MKKITQKKPSRKYQALLQTSIVSLSLFSVIPAESKMLLNKKQIHSRMYPTQKHYTFTHSIHKQQRKHDKTLSLRENLSHLQTYSLFHELITMPSFENKTDSVNFSLYPYNSSRQTRDAIYESDVISSIDMNGENIVKALKTSIEGNITTTEDTKILILNGSTVQGDILLQNGDNTIMLEGSLIEKDVITGIGNDVVWIGKAKEGFSYGQHYADDSTIKGSVNLGEGNNELVVSNRSQIKKDILLGDGNNSLTLSDWSTIGTIDIIRDTLGNNDTYTYSDGNISLGNGNNSVKISDYVTVVGDLAIGNGDNTLNVHSSTVKGKLLFGSGNNSIVLDGYSSNIEKGIEITGSGNNSISIKNGVVIGIQGKDTIPTQYADIILGSGDNSISFEYVSFGGKIFGSYSLELLSGAIWEGEYDSTTGDRNLSLSASQNIILNKYAQINSNITLQDASNTITVHDGKINGNILGGVGSLIISVQDRDDSQYTSSGKAYVGGNIDIHTLSIGEGASLEITHLNISSKDTDNPHHTIQAEDPIDRYLRATDITLGGDIIVHSSAVGDTLTVQGTINPKGGSFILDMNFEEKISDILDLSNATITGGHGNIVYFQPYNPVYLAEKGSIIENVIIGNGTDSVSLKNNDIGGYEYELVPSSKKPNTWDLRLVRISASNFAYAGIIENTRNYSKDVWTNVSGQIIQDLLSEHSNTVNILPNEWETKKIFSNAYLNAWITNRSDNNTIHSPNAPSIEEFSTTTTIGVGVKGLPTVLDDTIDITLFLSHGNTDSKLMQYQREHKMQLEAFSIGVQATFKIQQGYENAHTQYITLAQWGDLLNNTVNLTGQSHLNKWTSSSYTSTLSYGYQFRDNNFTVLTQVDAFYSFISGNNFITPDKNAIDIAEDHRLAMRFNLLVAYSFNFGLTPYLQVYSDIPLYSTEKGLIKSNGYEFAYDSEQIQTNIIFGANLAFDIGEIKLNAYISGGVQKSHPSSFFRELGWSVSTGISFAF